MPDSAAEREAILAATASLVAERSYAALELPVLCERAGLDSSGFYRHFVDLEDAFCAVVAAGTEELLRRALASFAAQPRWLDGLRAVAYTLRDFLVEDHPRAQVMVVESASACERSRAIRERGMAALAALIDAARDQLEDPARVPPQTAEITAGAIYNRIHAAVAVNEELTDGMVRELMYIAVRPYFGSELALRELRAAPPPRHPRVAASCTALEPEPPPA